MNIGAPWPTLVEAEARVLRMQTKLHQWASRDPARRFDDLFNLVADPAFLLVAWDRVRTNKGARTAGVDGATASAIAAVSIRKSRGGHVGARRDRFCAVTP